MYSLGAKKRFPLKWPDSVFGFAAQQGFDLLRNDRSTEHPGERVADGRLEFALDPREPAPFGYSCPTARLHLLSVYRQWKANESPACRITPAWYRDIVPLRHCEIVRIASGAVQGRARRRCTVLQALRAARRFGERAIRVIWSIGCFPGRVAEWQTRWLQVPVSFGTWGFKSPFAHTCDVSGHRAQVS